MVQGASRGIGLEFARQLAAREDIGLVVATCREPDAAGSLRTLSEAASLAIVALDVEDEASIDSAATAVAGHAAQIDLLVNCAGLLHDADGVAPERRLDQLASAPLLRGFAVNALGPALVVKHFRPLLQQARRPIVANLSARVGSITDNRLGGWYGYRASKAAQNMLTRCMAIELGRGRRPVTVVALHPGTVDTDLSRPFQRNVPEGKLFSTEQAVGQLLAIIDGLTPEDSGRFFAWDGSEIPW
jgi:NAD(P)-dependent dehydrogenase (short-subunit alcohol dehydrogenase family)